MALAEHDLDLLMAGEEATIGLPVFGGAPVRFETSLPPADRPVVERVLRTFLALGPDERARITPHLWAYRGKVEGSAWSEPFAGPEEIWEQIRICWGGVERQEYDPHAGVYLYLMGDCSWEEEHGLALSWRDGDVLARVSPVDGHYTNDDPDPAVIYEARGDGWTSYREGAEPPVAAGRTRGFDTAVERLWWGGELRLRAPMFDGAELSITSERAVPGGHPAAAAVLRAFLGHGPEERLRLEPALVAYARLSLEGSEAPEGMRNGAGIDHIWPHLRLSRGRLVARESGPHQGRYLYLSGWCAWAPDEGVAVTLRDGSTVVRVGPDSGEVVNSCADPEVVFDERTVLVGDEGGGGSSVRRIDGDRHVREQLRRTGWGQAWREAAGAVRRTRRDQR